MFVTAVDQYNKKYNLSSGLGGYWTYDRLKAQAMVEAGGSRSAFVSDPLQVNVAGDWVAEKASILGLKKGQSMTPQSSAAAALEWLRYKGTVHDQKGKPIAWRGDRDALRAYNGNNRVEPGSGGRPNKEWYADEVLKLELQANTPRKP